MRYRVMLLILLLAIGLISHVKAAPPPDQTWYFALTPTQIIAYTPDGDTNVLLETVNLERESAYRLDHQSAVVMVNMQDVLLDENTTRRLYYVTPESATLINSNVNLNDASLIFHNQSGAHVFFFDGFSPPEVTGLLLNLETTTIEPLSENFISANRQAVRFSADGQFLRYLRQEAEESWTIRERTLATGEERVIYSIEDELFPPLIADDSGENWLYLNTDSETRIRTTTLIHNDGTIELIAEESGAEGDYRTLFEDNLFITRLLCEADCPVELKPLSGEASTFYMMPVMDGILVPQRHLDNGDLLVLKPDDSSFWLLGVDGSATQIGYWNTQQVFTPLNELISPDGRWLAVVDSEDDPTGYKVWDTQNRAYILENDFHDDGFSFLMAFYSEDGFIVTESQEYSFAYRNSDQGVIELPLADERNYFTVLPDGTLLYQQYRPPSIFHYDPATQTETLLVEGAFPLVR